MMSLSVCVFLLPSVLFLIKTVDLGPVVFAEAVERKKKKYDPNISKRDLFLYSCPVVSITGSSWIAKSLIMTSPRPQGLWNLDSS